MLRSARRGSAPRDEVGARVDAEAGRVLDAIDRVLLRLRELDLARRDRIAPRRREDPDARLVLAAPTAREDDGDVAVGRDRDEGPARVFPERAAEGARGDRVVTGGDEPLEREVGARAGALARAGDGVVERAGRS